MATFLKATDGKTYINVDFIDYVIVGDTSVSVYTAERREDDLAKVYKVATADWLAYLEAQK